MNEDDDVNRKLDEISRGLRINRYLLVFTAVCTGIILFLPRFAVWIAETTDAIIQRISTWGSLFLPVIIGLGTVIAVAAYIVARIAPPAPDSRESRK